MTRKDFLQTMAGAAVTAAIPTFAAAAAPKGKPKRGVSIYSYTGDFGVSMTLEDCLADISQLRTEGEDIGLEILDQGHIEGYPNPSSAWIDNWWAMMEKYHIKPVEYGHWIDSKMFEGRLLSAKEVYPYLVRDIKLANRLGFTIGRTKIPMSRTAGYAENWQEIIEMALPDAEKYNFKMCNEIHGPTRLKSKQVDQSLELIQRTKTKNFGLNIDFSVFQNRARRPAQGQPEEKFTPLDKAADVVPLLPYVYVFHAKFWEMTDDLVEYSIPYGEVIAVLLKEGWEGYLLSEYEGTRTLYRASDQLRRHHLMMKRLLEA